MRETENTPQDVPTRSDRTSSKETFSIRYYFVDNFHPSSLFPVLRQGKNDEG